MSTRILLGDCRQKIGELPDASVQLCVTSPPYFGLRDYGTASWQGGEAGCDHTPERQARTERPRNGLTGSIEYVAAQEPSFRNTCGKCGATRVDQQIGLESSIEEYVAQLVAVFREVRRVLRDDGVLFLNLGDSYASAWPCNRRNEVGAGSLPNGKREARPPRMPDGLKEKDLIGIPWRVAFALQADGWYLRSDIIWAKPNPMPESVRDRPTKAHEYIFLLTKQPRYFWDGEAVREPISTSTFERWGDDPYTKRRPNGQPTQAQIAGENNCGVNPNGRNIRSVWTIATAPFAEAHFATFPPALAERCIKAGTSEKGACSVCGAPWVRVMALLEPTQNGGSGQPARNAEYGRPSTGGCTLPSSGRAGEAAARETIGWQPTCSCGGRWVEVDGGDDWITRGGGGRRTKRVYVPREDGPDRVPCVVLDPFAGSGTTGLVADRLGRDSILIELNGDYTEMMRRRIEGDAPMFTSVSVEV